jgi:hypothetical protein
MAEDSEVRSTLLARITSRRAGVQAYLRDNRPRARRRANVTIVLASLSALFPAGPAVGGEGFSGGLQRIFGLASDSYVWRVLCLASLLVSVAAAVLTNLGKSQDDAGRLSTAEAVDGELEGLAVLVEFGHLPVEDAVKLYQQYTAKISFIDDLAPVAAAAPPGPPPPPAQQPVAEELRTRSLPAVPPAARRPTGHPLPPPR